MTFAGVATESIIGQYYKFAGVVMIVYDIVITFGLEVEKIWKQRFSGVTVLWVINRWIYLLGAIVMLAEFIDSAWSVQDFFKYPSIFIAFQRLAVGAIFAMRIHCIYGCKWVITSIVAFLIVVEFIVKMYLSIVSTQAVLPVPGLGGCFESTTGNTFVLYWVFEVLTGILYFAVIFSLNILTVILFETLPPEAKTINAVLTSMITCVLVTRLILNLKVGGGRGVIDTTTYVGNQSRLETVVFGNIANELEDNMEIEDEVETESTDVEDFGNDRNPGSVIALQSRYR